MATQKLPVEDYYFVPSASAAAGSKGAQGAQSSKGKEETGGRRPLGTSKESGKVCVGSPGVPEIHTGLASVASPQPDNKSLSIPTKLSFATALGVQSADAALIRQLLLKQRGGLGSTEKSAERKHYYIVGQFALGNPETTLPLARIIGGTASNTRLTNTVKLVKLRMRFSVARTPTGPSVAPARSPIMRYLYWRDKIPATPGTAPTLWGTDSNPPSSNTLMFSRLGSAAVVHNATAVFNPITALDYHVYEARTHELNDRSTFDFTTPATAYGVAAPQKWMFDHEIHLHNVRQNYAAFASTAADVNDIYFTAICDDDYSLLGYLDYLTYTVDLEFEDVQDGE